LQTPKSLRRDNLSGIAGHGLRAQDRQWPEEL
jgi:hypothetical protein